VAEGRDWDPESGRLVLTEIVCPRCNGAGTVEVFRYPRPSSRTRLAPCCGCGARLKLAELVEVTEDDPSLTALAGDRLCAPCAGRHGIQR
jgi:RecJ-like exonuclease